MITDLDCLELRRHMRVEEQGLAQAYRHVFLAVGTRRAE